MENDKLSYFMHRTEQDFNDVKSDVQDIKDDVRKLLEFKWQIIGGSLVISVIVSTLVSILSLIFK